jgi:glycosyltransferase involved in cell wall biosynthesis
MSIAIANPLELPRVLLLSGEGPNLQSAGGILLYRLFDDYPRGKLRVIERNADPTRGHLHFPYASLAKPWQRFEQSRFNRMKRSLRAFGFVPSISLKKIDELLGGFRPDLVVCVMQQAAYYDAALCYARKRRVPLVLIVHDVNEQFEPVLPFAVAAWRQRDGDLYRYATYRLCVSQEMESLCARLYGVRGEVLYPNRSEELLPRPFQQSERLKIDGRLSVGFVGNLNYGYGEELIRLLPAFRASHSRLIVFSQPPEKSCEALLQAFDCVDFRGFVQADQAWRAIQLECDAVILPYPNPAGKMERLYRHHFPSKLPEYLALGMPVIVTGPNCATGVRWAQRNPTAVASHTTVDLYGVQCLLQSLRDKPDLRLGFAKSGFLAGELDFEPRKIKAQFLNYLVASTAAAGVKSHKLSNRVSII